MKYKISGHTPLTRTDLVKAISPFYKERKSDLYEMSMLNLRKLYKVVKQEQFINLMRRNNA